MVNRCRIRRHKGDQETIVETPPMQAYSSGFPDTLIRGTRVAHHVKRPRVRHAKPAVSEVAGASGHLASSRRFARLKG